jgi:cytochrome P450
VTSTDPIELTQADIAALHQEYDHFSELTVEDRRAEWERRRSECPVSYSSFHDGFVLLAKFEDAYNVLVDTSGFTSTKGAGIPPQPMPLIPEDLDPPEHRKFRKPINPALAPQVVATYESWVREYTVSLLDEIDRKLAAMPDPKEIDIVDDFARPLPQMVTLRLLGIPMEKLELVSRTTTLLSAGTRDEAGAKAGEELFGYLIELVEEKRNDPTADDMVATLVREVVDGEPIPHDYVLSMVSLLLFGGLHTTTGAIASTIVWLADHPADRELLKNDPTLIKKSLDEIIRFTSPSSHLGRVATQDTVIRGCPVRAGQRVMVGIGSGNHDPEKFEHPERMNWGQPANHHLGFGMGPHRCAGSHLAKLELQVALEEFVKRYDNYRVPDRSRLHLSGGEVRNLDYVPLVIEQS